MALIALLIPVSGSVGTTLSDAALRERICLSGLRGRKEPSPRATTQSEVRTKKSRSHSESGLDSPPVGRRLRPRSSKVSLWLRPKATSLLAFALEMVKQCPRHSHTQCGGLVNYKRFYD